MKELFLFSVVILLFSFSGCKKTVDCTLVLPEPNYFEITFVDSTGNSVLGTIDSLRLYNASYDKYIKATRFGDSSYLQIFYVDIDSNVNYFIELNNMDTDTLLFNYSIEVGTCFNVYIMDDLKYNGQNQTVGNNIQFDLIK